MIATQLTGITASTLQQNRRPDLANALVEAYSTIVYCPLSNQCITNAILPGLKYLDSLVNQVVPHHKDAVRTLVREIESKNDRPKSMDRLVDTSLHEFLHIIILTTQFFYLKIAIYRQRLVFINGLCERRPRRRGHAPAHEQDIPAKDQLARHAQHLPEEMIKGARTTVTMVIFCCRRYSSRIESQVVFFSVEVYCIYIHISMKNLTHRGKKDVDRIPGKWDF